MSEPIPLWVVVAYYSDGSSRGDTVAAVFGSKQRADRFVELAKTLYPCKELEVVEKVLEP